MWVRLPPRAPVFLLCLQSVEDFILALTLVESQTGITNYYKSLRTESLAFLRRHTTNISKTFAVLADKHASTEDRVNKVSSMLKKVGPIRVRDKFVSPLNPLAPVLACLDPNGTFPIMNDRTRRLLQVIGERHDPVGALALCDLIGKPGIGNSFELDVYSFTENFSHVRKPKMPPLRRRKFADLCLKSELDGFAQIAAKRLSIRRLA